MSVVRRCPSCGTEAEAAGECEACHEAQVGYFCTNHTPGLWLEAPVCQHCGARFGEPARGASATGVEITSLRVRSPAPARARASTSAPPAAGSRSARPEVGADDWIRRVAPPSADEPRATPERAEPSLGRQLGGCLARFALFVVLLILLLVGGLLLAERLLLP